MLPFLKHQSDVVLDNAEDESDKFGDGDEYDILSAVAEDILHAVTTRDKSLLKATLSALCDYIKEEDEVQDLSEYHYQGE